MHQPDPTGARALKAPAPTQQDRDRARSALAIASAELTLLAHYEADSINGQRAMAIASTIHSRAVTRREFVELYRAVGQVAQATTAQPAHECAKSALEHVNIAMEAVAGAQ